MKKIRILPEFIANQIAAGEVVQRPASVIKELVENSIDAGADSIAVIVKDAGKKLMHIIDNGSGMPEEDLKLSVKRHATSKIINQEDLENIHSFGFRGEALASIASVSLLEIRTKTDDAELGLQLIAEPNSDTIIKPFAAEKGTQVIVKNLFYNVPARRKFLKTNLTEFRHISDTMIKFALSNPDIRFTFYDDDTLVFDVYPSNLRKRIDEVLGRNSSDSMMELQGEKFSDTDIKISGFVGQPHLAGKTRSEQYIFLNKRPIMSRSLSHAVFSAFEQLLEKHQQPAFILNIEINPAQIDVNVHPQKNEVKFEDERYVYNLIKKTVKETLKKNSLIPNIDVDLDDSQSPFGKFSSENTSKFDSDVMIVNKMTGEIIENKSATQKNYSADFDLFSNVPAKRNFENHEPGKNDVSAFDELFGLNSEKPDNNQITHEKTEKFMQIHKKYIINESSEGIIIIDQHNAHERILYERALKAMNKDFSYAQQMLFPAVLELSGSQAAMIEELKDELLYLGYEFTFMNKTKIELTAVPKDISYGEEKDSMIELIEQYQEYKEIRQTDKRDNIAASFSCKSAIKTGKSLSYNEMKQLKEDLFSCEMPYVCPHGRPVILEFKIKELDNKFGRSKDLRFF
jgi:DNA mismatch repair protein MutL